MADESEFDILFTFNVSHILEKIFLSLDCRSLINCFEVSKSWNDFLTSEAFLRRATLIFCEDIQQDLRHAAEKGNAAKVRRILSIGLVDVSYIDKRYE